MSGDDLTPLTQLLTQLLQLPETVLRPAEVSGVLQLVLSQSQAPALARLLAPHWHRLDADATGTKTTPRLACLRDGESAYTTASGQLYAVITPWSDAPKVVTLEIGVVAPVSRASARLRTKFDRCVAPFGAEAARRYQKDLPELDTNGIAFDPASQELLLPSYQGPERRAFDGDRPSLHSRRRR